MSQVQEIKGRLELPIREVLAGSTNFALYMRSIYQTYSYFHAIHRQLPLLLTAPVPPAEVYTSLDALFPKARFPYLVPTAVYVGRYNFWELNASDLFKGLPTHAEPDRVVVALPYADFSNPLMWCVLAHEIGHAFEKKREIAGAALPSLPAEQLDILTRWAREFTADQVALRLLGSAYANAILALSLTVPPVTWRPSLTHPQPQIRFRLMSELIGVRASVSAVGYKKVFDQLADTFKVPEIHGPFQIKFRCQACRTDISKDLPAPAISPVDLWQKIRETLEADDEFKALTEFSEAAQAASRHLTGVLAQGRPISSYRVTEDAITLRTLEETLQKEPGQALEADKMYELLKGVEETPTTVAQILNAAWDHRFERQKGLFEQIFSEKSSFEGRFLTYAEYLTRIDYLVRKSIESSSVHGLLRR